jgi:ribose transport system permease protein
LATMVAFRGALKLVISGEATPVFNFDFLGQARLNVIGLEIPVAVLLLLGVSAFFYFVMHYTRYGQHMFAIGANPRAATLSGLHLERNIVIAFLLSGCAVALASYLLVSQVTVVDPTTGQFLEFQALTGVMIGGASLYGGRGSVFGTQVAILILAVIDNGLVLMQVVSFWQEVLRGGLLLVAVIFDQLGRRSKEVRMRI